MHVPRRLAKIISVDNLTSRSVSTLVALIRNGELKRGEKLPPQNVLAKKLGISRTALREALQELSYRGIIDSQHGRGTFVCDNIVQEEEVIEARLILEPQTARLAAERATAQELQDLKKLCGAMEQPVKLRNPEEFSDLDLKFHSDIADMSRNQALSKLMASLRDMMLHQQNVVQIIPGAMERAYIFHVEITRAIAGRETGVAENAMLRHLEDVAMTLQAANYKKRLLPEKRGDGLDAPFY
jgi:GntR family transcriptional repressor for pyruvate dehydrogenase complex